jgi:DDE superfamily endonuclease
MTRRRACPPAPGPLEEYAQQFDDLWGTLAQRRGFREYLQGLLLPRERNKTLTGLVGTEPIVGAQAAPVQALQFFLSESAWDPEAVNARRLELLLTDPATRPHDGGVLVLDDSGDRKAGTQTAHVGRQYLGSIGKVDNGIVAVTSLWADEHVYYPLHVRPYTPAKRLPQGKKDPAFRTKPQVAGELVDRALEQGVSFRAVVADCAYGDHLKFRDALGAADLPYVLAVKPSTGIWAPEEDPHCPAEAVEHLRWGGSNDPGDWRPIERRFRDGHTELWWAADLSYGPYGPDKPTRAIVATTDPATLPPLTTWYLFTNLPCPGSPQVAESPIPPADLAEVIRLYGLRNWVEQGYRQVKQELGWADFMVRSDPAIRRHWLLVCCAFSFCWRAWFADEATLAPSVTLASPSAPPASEAGGKFGSGRHAALLAAGAPPGPQLADTLDLPPPLVARLVDRAAPARAPTAPATTRAWPPAQPLRP